MKKIEMYQCEICNKLYHTEEEAHQCESKGKESSLVKLGDEVVWTDEWNGGFGVMDHIMYVAVIEDQGHYIKYELSYEKENDMPWNNVIIHGNEKFLKECVIK